MSCHAAIVDKRKSMNVQVNKNPRFTEYLRYAEKLGLGIADPRRIGITGVSYGGYATLAGLTFTPELYACGAEICGPANIKTLLESIPPYLGPLKKLFIRARSNRRFGSRDCRTPAGPCQFRPGAR